MKTFICFIRGGTASPNDYKQEVWKDWFKQLKNFHHLIDNGVLTINGVKVSKNGDTVQPFHFNPEENVSVYFILKANGLDEAISLTKDCPVFECGGNVTIRPIIEKYNQELDE
jgi:hypothetical protein